MPRLRGQEDTMLSREGLVLEGGVCQMDLGMEKILGSMPQVIGKGCYGRREAEHA